ncbi:MAG TPA: hypothetical protein VGK46_10465 [Saprospiraceae bacterium]
MSRPLVFIFLCTLWTNNLQAQFLDEDTTGVDNRVPLINLSDTIYPNTKVGAYVPGRGFQIVRNDFASLNISIYASMRWVNQLSESSTWEDHQGRTLAFDGRNDIYWQRAMIWFTGYITSPKLTYMATVWTVTTTQQTLVYGNLKYTLNKHLTVGMGIMPNACIRSLQGPFPFFTSTDRTMAEDALRGGFTNGFFIVGEALPKMRYTLGWGNNLSILGVKAANLTRHFSKSASLAWYPTTGEFGPRGGNGDFEHHEKMATRFGISYCHSRENRFNNVGTPAPDNTQVRMSDGLLFFETNAFINGLTVVEANFDQTSVDLGFKYKGFALHTEFYHRTLSKIDAVDENQSPVEITGANETITDNGYTLQALYMIVPKTVCIYAVNSMLIDEFKRNPYEFGGGVNLYLTKSRSWRINAQAMRIVKGAAGGTFGLYTSGQTGTTFTIGTDFLL